MKNYNSRYSRQHRASNSREHHSRMRRHQDTTSEISYEGINRSTRNWNAEQHKLTSVEEIPLLSRSDNSQAINGHSLKNPEKQQELWISIKNKIGQAEESGLKEDWNKLVLPFRKLREAVFSTMGDGSNVDFAIEVFELSVTTCIKADNEEELFKSFNRLVEEIYVRYPCYEETYFTSLYVLYILYKRRDYPYTTRLIPRLDTNSQYGKYAKDIVQCTKRDKINPIKYFNLLKQAPTDDFAMIVHCYDDTVRVEALNILRKAYLSVSIDWIRKWLGLYDESSDVVKEINRLQQGNCIKSFDESRGLIFFLKKKLL